MIVFVDESGLSERPTLARTWAPRGHTPVIQYRFNWKQLEVAAGISHYRFYFRLFNDAINAARVVQFLQALRTTIPQNTSGVTSSPTR